MRAEKGCTSPFFGITDINGDIRSCVEKRVITLS
jgi:hypothetical protein